MKKPLLITLIAAISATVVGALICVGAFAINGFDLRNFETEHYEKKTLSLSELKDGDKIKSLDLEIISHDIKIMPAEDSIGRIEYYESESFGYNIGTERKNGAAVLKAVSEDRKVWYKNLFSFDLPDEEKTFTVYLPKGEYDSLKVQAVSADLNIPEGYSFNGADITTVSGDVTLDKTDVSEKTYIKTTSGNIKAEGCSFAEPEIYTTSGDIDLDRTLCAGLFVLETTSGDSSLMDFDCTTAKIKTVSGDIKGRFLTPKTYTIDTVSGDVDVPKSEGGDCSVRTVSGDIEFEEEIFSEDE